jgi:enoyl-CoA hydratase
VLVASGRRRGDDRRPAGAVVVTGGDRCSRRAPRSRVRGPDEARRIGAAFREALGASPPSHASRCRHHRRRPSAAACELALAATGASAPDNAGSASRRSSSASSLAAAAPSGLPRPRRPAPGKEIILTGRQVRADEALRIGLVDEVVPPPRCTRGRRPRRRSWLRVPSSPRALAKAAIDEGTETTLAWGLDREQALFEQVFTTEDSRRTGCGRSSSPGRARPPSPGGRPGLPDIARWRRYRAGSGPGRSMTQLYLFAAAAGVPLVLWFLLSGGDGGDEGGGACGPGRAAWGHARLLPPQHRIAYVIQRRSALMRLVLGLLGTGGRTRSSRRQVHVVVAGAVNSTLFAYLRRWVEYVRRCRRPPSWPAPSAGWVCRWRESGRGGSRSASGGPAGLPLGLRQDACRTPRRAPMWGAARPRRRGGPGVALVTRLDPELT